MQDLNDLYYFVRVVDHHGFAPAARALGLQKSKLSRRIGALEAGWAHGWCNDRPGNSR
jgi:DNA-binding transcriptional LysR family regulator